MIRRVAHLCFVTDQLATMREFYEVKLGLPVQITFRNDQGTVFGYYFACGDSTFVEIFDRDLKVKQWGGDPEMLKAQNHYSHFCLEVTGLRDFKTVLEGRGVTLTELKMGIDLAWQSWTKDPDGNEIELMEYTGQSWQIQAGPQPKESTVK